MSAPLTLNDATLISRVYSVATRDLVQFLKKHGDFVYTERGALSKRAKNAKAVIAVCRRVIGPFVMTPSTTLKTLRSVCTVHDDWDSKILKLLAYQVDDGSSSSDIELIPEIETILSRRGRKRGRAASKPDRNEGALNDSPSKKTKGSNPSLNPPSVDESRENLVLDLKVSFSIFHYILTLFRPKSKS